MTTNVAPILNQFIIRIVQTISIRVKFQTATIITNTGFGIVGRTKSIIDFNINLALFKNQRVLGCQYP